MEHSLWKDMETQENNKFKNQGVPNKKSPFKMVDYLWTDDELYITQQLLF